MKRSFINKVKYSKRLYNLYYYCGSFAVKLLSLFIKRDDKKIVFSSFGGRKYDDSPRCIFETMINDPRFWGYKFVWAFGDPSFFDVKGASKVKCDTVAYYKELLSAAVWVTNSTMERGLYFKPKRIFNLNTWHGTAIKRMGIDITKKNTSFDTKGKRTHNDVLLAQGQYDVDIFSRAFGVPKENFRVVGLPRNDELVFGNSEYNRKLIRQKLGIGDNKTVILYAPTFREYDKDKNNNCVMTPPINWKEWKNRLGNDYVLMVRAHYEVVQQMSIGEDDFIKDVSLFPNLNELMIASDLLVSDYSSIFFDYSIQDKPMLCFTYDYEKYSKQRGMYFDIREKLDCYCENETDLISEIKTLDRYKRIAITRSFRSQFVEEAGEASKKTVDIIWSHLNNAIK